MKSTTKVAIFGLVAVALLFVGVIVSVKETSKPGTPFDIRERASTPGGSATISLVTDSQTHYTGDVFPVKVMLNTNGAPISAAQFRFQYPVVFTVGVADLEVVDQNTAISGIQIESKAEMLGSGMGHNINTVSQATVGGITYFYIDFSAITTAITGFTNNNPRELAVITFKVNAVGTKDVTHDPTRSKVLIKADIADQDILQTIPTYTYSLVADTQAPTVTITQGLDQAATSTISAQMFTWTGVDNPPRPADTIIPLTYFYRFDADAFTTTTNTTAQKTLVHGTHIFEVKARDPR
ncbi:MAG: hypothetical protein AAB874_01030, partial [Patescibacteria group bacterium]